jgi:hypothetical protein
VRYATNEQRRRRTLFKPTLRAMASWLIFRVAHLDDARRSRLENQPTGWSAWRTRVANTRASAFLWLLCICFIALQPSFGRKWSICSPAVIERRTLNHTARFCLCWVATLGRFAVTTQKRGNSYFAPYGTLGSGEIITFLPGLCASIETFFDIEVTSSSPETHCWRR